MAAPNFRKITKLVEDEITLAMPSEMESFDDIYEFLESNGYNSVRKQYDTYDGDYNSYVIPTGPLLKVMVMGGWTKYGGSKMIVVLDKRLAHVGITELRVMRIAKRMKYSKFKNWVDRFTVKYLIDNDFVWRDMDGVYGDIRDEQFLFGCKFLCPHESTGRDDEIIYDGDIAMNLSKVYLFFHELNTLKYSIKDELGV